MSEAVEAVKEEIETKIETAVEAVVEQAETRIEQAEQVAQTIADAVVQTELGKSVAELRDHFEKELHTWRENLQSLMLEMSTLKSTLAELMERSSQPVAVTVTQQSPQPIPQTSETTVTTELQQLNPENVNPDVPPVPAQNEKTPPRRRLL